MKRGLIFIFIILVSLAFIVSAESSQRESLKICKTNCKEIQKQELGACKENYENCNALCSDRDCKKICSQERTTCVRNANDKQKACQKQCISNSMPRCLNETYAYGEKFAQGCDICECKTKGKVSCKKEAFCNMNTTLTEDECTQGNGFYQALCNGPYFGIVCSQQKFCICQGNSDNECPTDYTCLTEFISPNKRTTIEGWKTLRGQPLGEIGVCAR